MPAGRSTWVVPIVLGLILGVLYVDLSRPGRRLAPDAPGGPRLDRGGAISSGGWGFPFTVTTWVGYIACFGMATSTGIIMLVYLREAVESTRAAWGRSDLARASASAIVRTAPRTGSGPSS